MNNGLTYTIHFTAGNTLPLCAQCSFSTLYRDWRGPRPQDASCVNAANASENLGLALQILLDRDYTSAANKDTGAMPCEVILTTPAPAEHAEISIALPLPQEHQSAAQRACADAITAKDELMQKHGGRTCARQNLIWLDQHQKNCENVLKCQKKRRAQKEFD